MKWVQLRSWHYIRDIPEVGPAVTLCGRRTSGMVWYHDPPDSRSCETCIHIADKMAR